MLHTFSQKLLKKLKTKGIFLFLSQSAFFKNSATSLTTPCPLQCPPLLLPQTLDSSSEFLTQPTTPHPHYYHSNLDLCLFLTNLQTAVFSFFQYNLDLYIIGNLIIHLHQRDHCSKTHLLPTCYEINPYSLAVFACSFIYPFNKYLLKAYHVSDIHLGA